MLLRPERWLLQGRQVRQVFYCGFKAANEIMPNSQQQSPLGLSAARKTVIWEQRLRHCTDWVGETRRYHSNPLGPGDLPLREETISHSQSGRCREHQDTVCLEVSVSVIASRRRPAFSSPSDYDSLCIA